MFARCAALSALCLSMYSERARRTTILMDSDPDSSSRLCFIAFVIRVFISSVFSSFSLGIGRSVRGAVLENKIPQRLPDHV